MRFIHEKAVARSGASRSPITPFRVRHVTTTPGFSQSTITIQAPQMLDPGREPDHIRSMKKTPSRKRQGPVKQGPAISLRLQPYEEKEAERLRKEFGERTIQSLVRRLLREAANERGRDLPPPPGSGRRAPVN